MPHLSKKNTKFKQAEFMQRQRRVPSNAGGYAAEMFHAFVIGAYRDDPAVAYPFEQCAISAIERHTGVLQPRGVGRALHVHYQISPPSIEAQKIAALDDDLLSLEGFHQLVVADGFRRLAKDRIEIDQHPAPLRAGDRQCVKSEPSGEHFTVGCLALLIRTEDVILRCVTVVINRLGDAVPIGVELLPPMG